WQMRFEFADHTPEAIPADDVVPTREQPSAQMRIYTVGPPAPLPGEYREGPSRLRRVVHPLTRRVSSVLPVPKPLPDAIAAGHFGQDDDGKPNRPQPEEVRAITEAHAEQLVSYLCRIDDFTLGGKQQAADAFNAGIAKYAEDFGQPAADRLWAYCHRMADSPERAKSAWQR
ncbi:MAG: hypothetical protein JWM57_678, partial [Phycisphaerales bacterium]|nr:hypothetical protein [Phycisphaerales bacterium]